jgi:23S rRNA pseudouridine2605 synthase
MNPPLLPADSSQVRSRSHAPSARAPSPRRPPRGQAGGRPLHQAPGALKGRLSLARALSKFGVCSRKEAIRLIGAGRVAVDGRVCDWPALRIDPRRSRVTVDGMQVGDDARRTTLVLHKPVGYITSRTDPKSRATVYDLLRGLQSWVFPVGRLDRDSAGLLVLTNDHRLGHHLTSPNAHVAKTYHVRVQGAPSREAQDALREGLVLDDGAETRPAQVRVLGTERGGASSWLEIILTEGKNRQVRRMCAAIGHDVLSLVRVAIGRLELGALPPGRWRRLSARDIMDLCDAPPGLPRGDAAHRRLEG